MIIISSNIQVYYKNQYLRDVVMILLPQWKPRFLQYLLQLLIFLSNFYYFGSQLCRAAQGHPDIFKTDRPWSTTPLKQSWSRHWQALGPPAGSPFQVSVRIAVPVHSYLIHLLAKLRGGGGLGGLDSDVIVQLYYLVKVHIPCS